VLGGRGYLKKIENEKKRTAEVEAEIEAVQKEVADQRKAVGGLKLAEQENLRKQKQVKALEVWFLLQLHGLL
jgi:cell fate regulator YaaT (PSP1 superfamily)